MTSAPTFGPGGAIGASADLSTPPATLSGAGASSIQPFFSKAFYEYNLGNPKVTVNYDPSGSGPGVAAIQQNTVNFGDSEIPMTAAQLAAATAGSVVQVPVDLGGVALAYNIPGVGRGLQLTGDVLAQIYLGTITTWNSPKITSIGNNAALNLPALPIVPVYRADTSGPGYDLDQYLIDTSSTWTGAIGTTKASTTWPEQMAPGVGQKLNAGVASYIGQTQGAIGYIEYAYALQGNFTTAALQNTSGAFVSPSIAGIADAASENSNLSATTFNIVYEPGAATYPLANFSWTLVYQKQPNIDNGLALGHLIDWVVTTGQTYAASIGYAPLPSNAVALAQSTIRSLTTSSGQLLFS